VYVHLGGEVVVSVKDIVGIFDARLLGKDAGNQRFLEIQRRSGRVLAEISVPDCKSVVITSSGVYGSPISPGTLARRILQSRAVIAQWGEE